MKKNLPEYIDLKTRSKWRIWLKKNHNKEKEIWLVHYKKHAQDEGIIYEEGVQEALCFGWIDGMMRSVDEDRIIQRYTPRRKDSIWSLANKKRVEKLIKEKKMTPAGMKLVEIAKKNGMWEKAYTMKDKYKLPEDLKSALVKNKKAWGNFKSFANSYRNMYIGWVEDAKREETRKRRIKETVRRSVKNLKPGMTEK